MIERPKTTLELANEILLKSNPSDLLRERGEKSPSLDDDITNKADMMRRQSSVRLGA